MICPKCGAQLPDDAKFCGGCGYNVTAAETNPAQQQTVAETNTDTTQGGNIPTETNQAASAETADQTTSAETTQTTHQAASAETSQTTTGNPQQAADNYNTGNPSSNFNGSYPNAEAAADKKGLLILAGIAVVAVVVIILLFNLIFGGNSWKDVVKQQVKYYNGRKDNIEDYYTTTYGEICGTFNYEQAKLIAKLTDNDDWEDDMIDEIEDTYDSIEDLYGKDWKMDYDITSKKKLSDSKLDDISDDWEDAIESLEDRLDTLDDIDDPEDYDDEFDDDDLEDLIKFYEKWVKKLEKMKVKKGYKVKYEMTIEGDDDDDDTDLTEQIVKIGGDWVSDSFYFEYPSILY